MERLEVRTAPEGKWRAGMVEAGRGGVTRAVMVGEGRSPAWSHAAREAATVGAVAAWVAARRAEWALAARARVVGRAAVGELATVSRAAARAVRAPATSTEAAAAWSAQWEPTARAWETTAFCKWGHHERRSG
jgi:hypothetical protein